MKELQKKIQDLMDSKDSDGEVEKVTLELVKPGVYIIL